MREGRVSRFSVEMIFYLIAPNFPCGESLSVSSVSSIETILDRSGEGSIKVFCRVFFRLTVPKTLLGEPFCAAFLKFSGIEKVNG